jgi:CheY-like chemotaxis protein
LRAREHAASCVLVSALHDRELNGLELTASVASEMERGRVALILTAESITVAERRLLERLGPVQILLKPASDFDVGSALSRAGEIVRARSGLAAVAT